MAFIINENMKSGDITHKILVEINSRFDRLEVSINGIDNIEFFFLKITGYCEQLVDELIIDLCIMKNPSEIGIRIKNDTLVNFFNYKPLEDAVNKYKKLYTFRNNIAHKPDYHLGEDFFKIIECEDIMSIDPLLIKKELILKYVSDLIHKILFIKLGLQHSSTDDPFLIYTKNL